MKPITLLQPPRIVFGNGCAAQCAGFLSERGISRVLLITSKSVLPNIRFLVDELKNAGCEAIQLPFVDAEPTVAQFEAVLAKAAGANAEGVLGIGGGSVLDVAKLVAALAGSHQKASDVFGINVLKERKLFLVCLPTTAGTGSEVSPNSILLDEEAQLKKGVISPHLVPDAAFVDPLLTLSVPATVTAATGLDALTHCIEAYANNFAHPMVDLHALEGMRLIGANLLRAVQNGADAEARAALALGSLYGGMCLGPVNTAAVHALAYPLGGRFRIAHGASNALLLPHVLKFNLSSAPKRYAEIALALGVDREMSDEDTAISGFERISDLSRECGVPQSLREFGIARDAIPAMARAAMQVTRLLKNNPRPLNESDAAGIYEQCY